MSHTIHIVTLIKEDFSQSYLLTLLCDIWRSSGYIVSVGPSTETLDADIGIIHIDRTWIPASAIPGNEHSKPLLNGNVLDISKRLVSSRIIDRAENYDGPVIVKSDANYFGSKDQGVGARSIFARRAHQLLVRMSSWTLARQLRFGEYPILQNKELVPRWVWKREDLVVEQFTPEMEDDLYVLRLWIFLGDREYGVKMLADTPIVKSSNMIRYEYIFDVPQEIRTMREVLGFDFGKFDYVISGGIPVLIDANKTPSITSSSDSPGPNLLNLAEGIHSYIGQQD